MRIIGLLLSSVVLAAALALPFGGAQASSLRGDVNDDCRVDVLDLGLASQHFGFGWGSLQYSPVYDLNNDRKISVMDLQIIASQMGLRC